MVFISSATSFHICQKVGNTAGEDIDAHKIILASDDSELVYTPFELDSIAAILPDSPVIRPTKGFEESFSSCEVFHYAGHAHHNREFPKSSFIGGSAWTLTVGELSKTPLLPSCKLAFINGCESGFVNPDEMDDYISFPTALLFSGAKSVISTLWPVEDLPAALLAIRFHQILHENPNAGPAEALQDAQAWLRGDHPNGPIDGRALVNSVLPKIISGANTLELKDEFLQKAADLEGRFPTTPPFASPVHWTAYVFSGQDDQISIESSGSNQPAL